MNPLDRLPGPYPRGERDGFNAFHVVAAFFGTALVLLAVAVIVLLLWNSFKVRTEVRTLRGEVARLSGAAAVAASPGVNTAAWAVAPASAAAPNAAPPGTPPTAPPATATAASPASASENQPTPAAKGHARKTPRTPRKKPADPVE